MQRTWELVESITKLNATGEPHFGVVRMDNSNKVVHGGSPKLNSFFSILDRHLDSINYNSSQDFLSAWDLALLMSSIYSLPRPCGVRV